MKKIFFGLAALTMAVGMFSCGKDSETTPGTSGQDSTKTPVDTVKTPVDTAITGIYFRVHYDDTTIIYKPITNVQSVMMMNGSTTFMADYVAGHMFTFDLPEMPKDTGMYKADTHFSIHPLYVSDTLALHVTKVGKEGEQMEATFNGVLHNYDDAKQTKTFKGDLRVTL